MEAYMARNWVEFEEFSDHRTTEMIFATMNPKGEIVVNRYTYDFMEQPEAVILLFDPDNDTIGIRPASPLMPNAFRVRPRSNCGHRVVYAKRFAKKHDIRLDYTVRFSPAEIEDGILILDLRKMASAARGPRKKPGSRQ